MTAKEWLNRGWKLNNEINQLLEAKRKAFELATKAATGTAEERVQTTKTNTSENRMIRLADYDIEIDRQIDKLVAIKHEILTAISAVEDPTCRALLVARYINFKTWEDIAEDIDKSERWVRTNIHQRALKKMESVIHSPR